VQLCVLLNNSTSRRSNEERMVTPFIRLVLLFLWLAAVSFAAKSLVPERFREEVQLSDQAWLVKFYSTRCGSCTEFQPVWNSLISHLNSFHAGELSIDTKEGVQLAERLGVLDEGLPCVRLFYNNHDQPDGVSMTYGT
jgi:hypothetical protein